MNYITKSVPAMILLSAAAMLLMLSEAFNVAVYASLTPTSQPGRCYWPVPRRRLAHLRSHSSCTGSASWWFRAGRHHQCKDVLFDGRAGRVISAGEQG